MINGNYNKLLKLKLEKMAELYMDYSNQKVFNELPFDDKLAILLDAEILYQDSKAVELMRTKATIKIPSANANDIDFLPERCIDKNLTMRIMNCEFINDKLNVIVTGATGAGKTYYVSALANEAINKRIRTKYIRLPDLLYELSSYKSAPKLFKNKLKRFSNYDLLIIDDWLLTKLDSEEQSIIFELLELRSDNKSTVLASQFTISGWHDKLGSGAIADAVMDRICHNSYIIDIKGDISMRERKSRIRNNI